jgi:HAMP domain-containing protein
MLKKLKLRQKFTALLLVILLGGLVLSGMALSAVLRQNARRDITSTALILLETMSSVRDYTTTQINPELIQKLDEKFLPQTIPAYSAREVFELLRKNPEYRDFFYKEATLNPTNLRDKADAFEAKLVEQFRANDKLKELSGFRATASGETFYIARPNAIGKASCLQCHSTPEAAPATVIERYGSGNGFGWHLNEIVGAKIISVPADTVIHKANQSSLLILAIVFATFIGIILLINLLLNRYVIRPLKHITRLAEEVSTGQTGVEFKQLSDDEIGSLTRAFRRMQLSLEMALRRLNRVDKSREIGKDMSQEISSNSNS